MQLCSVYDRETGSLARVLVNAATIGDAATREFVARRGKPVAGRAGWYRLTAHAYARRPLNHVALRTLVQDREAKAEQAGDGEAR